MQTRLLSKANARPRRPAIYCYGCQPRRGDSIRDLALAWGIDLAAIECEEQERALAELHADPDWGDQPSWGRP